jgi:hypothetical protein
MMWIPLAACAVVFLAYARSVATKHTCSGECLFCARDGVEAPPGEAVVPHRRPAADPDLPLSA